MLNTLCGRVLQKNFLYFELHNNFIALLGVLVSASQRKLGTNCVTLAEMFISTFVFTFLDSLLRHFLY